MKNCHNFHKTITTPTSMHIKGRLDKGEKRSVNTWFQILDYYEKS